MAERPAITISTRDFDRLSSLLEKQSDENTVVLDLLDELDRAALVEPQQVPTTVVTMNSLVRFENEDTGQTREIELVWPHEVDGSPNKLSILAPAGAALLGLSVGDSIEWPGPGNKKLRLKLIEVLRQGPQSH